MRQIVFEGNLITRPEVMLREVTVHVGDPADPARIEQSRQAVQDLGLFRGVAVRQEPVEGGVRLVFTVKEKWYILPLPRIGYDSDNQLSYGGQLTWYNVAGLDHTLRLNWVHGKSSQPGHASGESLSISYDAPVLDGSPWKLAVSGGRERSPVETPTAYDEYTDHAQFVFSRRLAMAGPFSQGWSAGGGLLWQDERTNGDMAPPSEGNATALVGVASYRNFHDLIYSDVGSIFNLRAEFAAKGLASDYGYEQLAAGWRRDLAVGSTPFQSLNFVVDGAARFDGPGRGYVFSLGGRNSLHGYRSGFVQGNAYYHLGLEYLHPIGWNWLRGLVVVDAGNAFQNATDFSFTRIRTSIGVGLRARVSWLVNFEIEAGVAVPLEDFKSPRFFGGRVSD